MNKDTINIGTINKGYPLERNVTGTPVRGVQFQKTYDLMSVYRLFCRSNFISQYLYSRTAFFTHCDFGINIVDLLHFFNHVSLTTTPWIVTYETEVPRWNSGKKIGLHLLARDSCKRIIALSECARHIQRQLLNEYPEHRSAILSKITVLHPPQQLNVESCTDKGVPPSNGPLFTLVGGDFFRKGGREVLQVFDRLFEEGHNVRLAVVSSLECGDYASKTTREDREWARQLIDKHEGRIEYFHRLPNDEVIELFKRSHVGLLPSYGDTYGYSVLEAQSCGCPVITTDIRALPEINNDETGWLIEVPKDQRRDGQLSTPEERQFYSQIVADNLYQIIREIIKHPQCIQEKGNAAISRIRTQHDPDEHAKQLEAIYSDALS